MSPWFDSYTRGVPDMFLTAVVAVLALLALYVVAQFNALVRLRNRVDNAWAQIDVQLRQRYDLIPNLVETVKGYATHERETLEGVIAARRSGVDASGPHEQAAAENVITGALGKLFALSEAYPDLKANENFLNLQEQLTGLESKIAYARQFYNDAVTRLHTKIESFPSNLIAGPFGFTEREYYEAEGDARGPVRVDF